MSVGFNNIALPKSQLFTPKKYTTLCRIYKQMFLEALRPVSAGVVFGTALTLSRVYLPTVIIQQMRLTDFHMLEVFLTASAASG